MSFFTSFLSGVGEVLSFGWPIRDRNPIRAPEKAMSDDWTAVAGDLHLAIEKGKKNNDPTR